MNNLVALDESCFICNNKQNKVLNSLRLNLTKLTNKDNCSYYFSIAFITQAGLAPLLMLLKQLDELGIRGKIITSDYLNYTSPIALDKLLSLKHVELKIFKCTSLGFHTKGYIFFQDQNCELILGSANLTLSALSTNHEWNVAIKTDIHNSFVQAVLNEFNNVWSSDNCLYYKDYRQEYHKLYIHNKSKINYEQNLKIKPNTMQQNFIEAFTLAYTNNIKKGLLLSATGTGKTIACMLALKKLNVKKVLFVVHREFIARQALQACKQILNKDGSVFIGKQKDYKACYIFATFQSLYAFNKDIDEQNFKLFNKDYFDIIIVDEAHHIGASSYKSIIDYFKPKFLLGMSASIKRSDDFDVLSYFDNNVIYEISLKEALANNYLCPFHYYAISDIELIDDNTIQKFEENNFNKLDFNLRVDKIIEAANYYGIARDRLCGLIFCSTNNEALMLEQTFNQKNFKTKALSAKHSQAQREDAIAKLCSNNKKDKLDYIISVDIFNEGIDIPMLNQIIMLRPTQSALVFIQQLGRGLRHYANKEFVVILDFIGNYNNNYMIPLALSSNTNLNKEELRLFTLEANNYLNGTCSINIDKIATSKILNALDKVNFNTIKYLKDGYFEFARRFKTYPLCFDFALNEQISPLLYFEKFGSLYNFQKQYDTNFTLNLSPKQSLYIEYICKYLCDGKRTSELELIDLMVNGLSLNKAQALLKQQIGVSNCLNFLLNNFDYQASKFDNLCLVEFKDDDYYLCDDFKSCFLHQDFNLIFKDLVKFNNYVFSQNYSPLYEDTAFCLYKSYSYHDILRLLGYSKKLPPIDIAGGKYFKELNIMPLFINYIKDDDKKLHYSNRFIENKALLWYSRANTKLTSPAISALVEQDKLNSTILIFIRKYQKAKDKSHNNFYFLGKASTDSYKIVTVDNKKLIEFKLNLKNTVDSAIYDYLINC